MFQPSSNHSGHEQDGNQCPAVQETLERECCHLGTILGKERCLAAPFPLSTVFLDWLLPLGAFIFISIW